MALQYAHTASIKTDHLCVRGGPPGRMSDLYQRQSTALSSSANVQLSCFVHVIMIITEVSTLCLNEDISFRSGEGVFWGGLHTQS